MPLRKWLFKFPTLSRLTNWMNAPVLEPLSFPADDYDILTESVPAPTITKVKEITIKDPRIGLWNKVLSNSTKKARQHPVNAIICSTQIKPVRDANGTDYYIKIHLPKHKRLPKLSLSGLKD
ncbi:MAG: hypothetical protein IPJ46_01025 [Anaerolineales bacterium]|nr:hypothetical protein [Anaerolineales bacterium]